MARKIKHTAYFWSRYVEQREKGYDHEDALAIAATIEDRHNAKARRQNEVHLQKPLANFRPIRVTHIWDRTGEHVSYVGR